MHAVGDLGYHIKLKAKKNEYFTEEEILNWFTQICLALEYIHGRKVLHRDLKASNIFLTGNNFVKLGDFGISRVLENTNEQAMTVVGTPYYMSPEVCENKPYTFKSDTWALGCVLYELCTLKHAFSADNLLGLVYKIVQGKYDPIPSQYSEELSKLVTKLLSQETRDRPSVKEVLLSDLIKKSAEKFVANQGMTAEKKLYVRKTPTVGTRAQREEQKEEVDEGAAAAIERELEGLTPMERMKRRKELEAQRKMEEMKAAAMNAQSNYS